MIEADDMDHDIFTPASSTSLASIFGKSQSEAVPVNDSLKYLPPKQSKILKSEEQKATECVFASALLGYEWFNGAYVAKGKLGFAIVKVLNSGLHNIILYDSSKKTLSCATITPKLMITFKENTYFSFLDNSQKYWCLYSSEEELKNISKLFEKFGADIQVAAKVDKDFPKLKTTLPTSFKLEPISTSEVESDTDNILYKKTKMSILHRMANMGHSVLPSQALTIKKSSSSSDTSDNDYKTNRNKLVKNITKRNSTEKSATDTQALVEVKKFLDHTDKSIENVQLVTSVSSHLMPTSTSNIIANTSSCSGNDFNFFITEQRVNNSELRINVNRVNDKVDQILFKISAKEISKENISGEYQMDIMQKLLTEYENKIKNYEELLRNKHSENTSLIDCPQNQQTQINQLLDKIKRLESQLDSKIFEISEMEIKLKILQSKQNNETAIEKDQIETLTKTIQNLNLELSSKHEELLNLTAKFENKDKNFEHEEALKNQVKNILNDTFQSISINFDNDKNYTGETVKKMLAYIIKKITIETL